MRSAIIMTGILIFDGLLQLAGQKSGLEDQSLGGKVSIAILFIMFFIMDVVEFSKKFRQ